MTRSLTLCAVMVMSSLVSGCIQTDRPEREAGDTAVTSDTTTSTATRADGTADGTGAGDTSGCTGCVIAGACVEAGTSNPDNVCETCAPDRNATQWVATLTRVQCDDEDPCTTRGLCVLGHCATVEMPFCGEPPACAQVSCDEDTCGVDVDASHCLIDGVCVDKSSADGTNVCRVCDPELDQLDWSETTADCNDHDACTYEDRCQAGVCAGTPNDCGDPFACTLDFCDGGQCQHQIDGKMCLIGDACVSDGTIADDDQCHVCKASADQQHWSPRTGLICDDDDACTDTDVCEAGGGCRGTKHVVGVEPNDEPGHAVFVAQQGVTSYPAGSFMANLNPLTDRDFFVWPMPLVSPDGSRLPKATLTNGTAFSLTVCALAACGQTLAALSEPVAICAPGDAAIAIEGRKGCCHTVDPSGTRSVSVTASCVGGGTVQQGLGYAAVFIDANVATTEGPTCGDYSLEWGAASP